jgi:hypothetical protein
MQSKEQQVKSRTSTAAKSQVVHEILVYLAEHPEAQDTLEGIVEWWLMEQQIKWGIVRVKEALAELVAQRLILERKGKDGRIHYRVNQREHGRIKVLLKEQPR